MSTTRPQQAAPTSTAERRRALAELYHRERRSLVRLALLLVDDPGTAEEVVQDAFVALDRSWDRVQDPDRRDAYLRSIVCNGARAKLRRRRVERKHPPAPPGTAPPAEELAVRAAHAEEVLAVVRTLPHRQREVLVLRYWEDLPLAEIADVLDVSVGSVKTHLHRATAAVAARLEGTR